MDALMSPMIAKIRIVSLLRHSGAQTVAGVVRSLRVPAELARRLLDDLVTHGQVEALRPVCGSGAGAQGGDGDYYRWIRPSDFGSRWQLRVLRQPPLSGYKLDRRLASLTD
jgi:hypothetical protein